MPLFVDASRSNGQAILLKEVGLSNFFRRIFSRIDFLWEIRTIVAMGIQIFFVAIGVIFLLGIFVIFLRRKRKLSGSDFQKFSTKILETKTLDPAHAILESHKIFAAALGKIIGENAKKMTAAARVSQFQKRFPNQKQIWNFHRLRNRIAHETDARVSSVQADQARENFVRALRSLTR